MAEIVKELAAPDILDLEISCYGFSKSNPSKKCYPKIK